MEAVSQIDYSIVVPLYNEEENLRPLYSRIVRAMEEVSQSYQIIFVDDGSRDNTFRILSELCDEDPRIVIVRLRKNFGQTAALRAGFDFALGDVVISMDGDLQHDPAEIPAFITKLNQGYDIDRRTISLPEPIRTLGAHEVSVRLKHGVQGTFRVNVVSE